MSRAIPMMDIPNERLRGVGILSANRGEGKAFLPLAGVKISAQVADRVATVMMTETFQNPYPEHLETVYIFPLPGGAAVSDFEMRVGDRVIKGKVEERGEARRQYQEAIDQGKRAALMEKERDDVFTVQVGNIPPGEEITVKITYSERLPFYEDGAAELRLPLVVAPRYIPGQPLERDSVGDGIEQDTNLVPDASRITPPRLAEGFDPKVALSIDVALMWDDADELGEIHNLTCSQHATRTSAGREGVKVALAYDNEPLNRDFVLRWTLSGKKLKPSLLFHQDSEGKSYGMLSLIPPYNEGQNNQARDVVFVLDHSGSMQGIKMSSASRACALLINTLGPDDRFAIQIFDTYVTWFKGSHYQKDGHFIPADAAGIEQGEKYLRGVTADGGTEMHPALTQAITALKHRRNSANRVPVIVMLTDGEVGNESHILKEMQNSLGDSRLFTVGIDTAVNQGFLQRLADVGQGTATFVTPGEQLEDALVNVGREIGVPLVVNLSIEDVDSGLELESIAPSKIVDLFSGRATTTFFTIRKIGKVRVKGRYPNGDRFEVVVTGKQISLPAISQLWAKTRINDLEDRYRVDTHIQQAIKQQIIELSIKHKILTKFTAFVAVDEEVVNEENLRRKVVQPVEAPANWDMKVSAPTQPTGAPMAKGKMMSLSLPSSPAPASMPISGFSAPPPPPLVAPKPAAKAPGAPSRSQRPQDDPGVPNLTSAGAVIGNVGSNLDQKAASLRGQLDDTLSLNEISQEDYYLEDDECFEAEVSDSNMMCDLMEAHTDDAPIVVSSSTTVEMAQQAPPKPKPEAKPATGALLDDAEASLDELSTGNMFGQSFASEFEVDKPDFETHYNLGLAYKDMELFDDAIEQFQLAFKASSPDSDDENYFNSCNMLGHCFLGQKNMSKPAVVWFKRAIEWAIKAFIDAYSKTLNQEKIFVEYLERIQTEALKSINAAELAQNLPKTTNFFSTSATAIIKFLERGYGQSGFDSYRAEIEEVTREADARLSMGGSLFATYEAKVANKLKNQTASNTEVETQTKDVVEGDKKGSFWDSSV